MGKEHENEGFSLLNLANELETFILSVVPDAMTVSKYGGHLFTLKPDEKEGQFCGVFIYKQHVQLVFSQGAQLNDPGKILCGSGQFRRHINFTPTENIDYGAVEILLNQASKLS